MSQTPPTVLSEGLIPLCRVYRGVREKGFYVVLNKGSRQQQNSTSIITTRGSKCQQQKSSKSDQM